MRRKPAIILVTGVAAVILIFLGASALRARRARADALQCRQTLQALADQKKQYGMFYNLVYGAEVSWEEHEGSPSFNRPGRAPCRACEACLSGRQGECENPYIWSARITEPPTCPGGGTYQLNPLDQPPTCSLADQGHFLSE